MLQKDQRAKQDLRSCGEAHSLEAKVPTYQDLLDNALDDTFPASDPIATSAAAHTHEPHTTARDCNDWTLRPGAGGEERQRSGRCEARLERPLQLGHRIVPAGPCEVEQSDHSALLCWREAGRPRRMEIDLDTLRRLLADGQLWRRDPA